MAATLNYNHYRVPRDQPYAQTAKHGDTSVLHNMKMNRDMNMNINFGQDMNMNVNLNPNMDHIRQAPWSPTQVPWNKDAHIHAQHAGGGHTYNISGKRNRVIVADDANQNYTNGSTTYPYATSHTNLAPSQLKQADESGLAKVIKRIRLSSPEQRESDVVHVDILGNTCTSKATRVDSDVHNHTQPTPVAQSVDLDSHANLRGYTRAQTPTQHGANTYNTQTVSGSGTGFGMGVRGGYTYNAHTSSNLDPQPKHFAHSKVIPLDDRPVCATATDSDLDMEAEFRPPSSKPEEMQVVVYSKDKNRLLAEQNRANFNSIPAHVLCNLSIHRPVPIPTDLNALVVYNESVAKGRTTKLESNARPLSQVEEIDEGEDDDDVMLM